MSLYKLNALELHKKLIQKEMTALEICRYFLNRIEKLDGEVGAFLSVFQERAQEKAHQVDVKIAQGQPVGKLAGIPIGIKDNIHVQGTLTTCASNFLKNYQAPFNATVTELIEKEDGIIMGKLNLDEFAMGGACEFSAIQKTVNPWNAKWVPGGSSGGSAAAVSARLVPLALGSDTGGSVRLPASYCNVVGFKPTYGHISRYGLVAFASSLDQIGPISTCIEDSALMLEAIGKPCAFDSTSCEIPCSHYLKELQEFPQKCRIGIPGNIIENLKPHTKDQFHHSIKLLEKLGVEIIEIPLNYASYSVAIYYILATAEASTNLARFDGIRYGWRSKTAKTLQEIYAFSKDEGFGDEVKRRIILGTYALSSGHQEAFYRKAQKMRTLVVQELQEAFKLCDAIAMPVSPILPFEFGAIHDPIDRYLGDIFTIPANLAGCPAVSIPSGFTNEHKPFGLQLISAQRQDDLLLKIAHGFEKISKTSEKIPPRFDREV